MTIRGSFAGDIVEAISSGVQVGNYGGRLDNVQFKDVLVYGCGDDMEGIPTSLTVAEDMHNPEPANETNSTCSENRSAKSSSNRIHNKYSHKQFNVISRISLLLIEEKEF